MRTIGEVIRQARVKKKLSRAKLEQETKIRREFIEAVEKQEWSKLPELPVVTGFVKNIAQTLGLNKEQTVALLRRDYPPKNLRISPKPDISDKFTWSPRLTFFVGVFLVAFLIIVYLGLQYVNFISPPSLAVDHPQETQVVSENTLRVSGATDVDATVSVNNQPVLIKENGEFETEIEIFEGTNEVVVIATSRSGKQTIIRRKIIPKLEIGN